MKFKLVANKFRSRVALKKHTVYLVAFCQIRYHLWWWTCFLTVQKCYWQKVCSIKYTCM